MTIKYTEQQLNRLTKADIIQLFMSQQEQLDSIDKKLQLVLEQLADMNRRRYGRSTEKSDPADCEQISFKEVDGQIVFFNEAEAVVDQAGEADEEDEITVTRKRGRKKKGKREEDLSGLEAKVIKHTLSDEKLRDIFGDEEWTCLKDEISNKYGFTPAQVYREEHHIAVYKGKKTGRIVKAPHPHWLLRTSLVSSSMEAAVINAKYTNAVPLYRQEQEFNRRGIKVTRTDLARWTIKCAELYLSVLYDVLCEKVYTHHVIQADETPVLVNHDGRDAGAKSYMWVYRTGRMNNKNQIVIYQYQKTRNASHPREFLKGFKGVCVTDGYQVYHTIADEREDLTIAGCWAHSRRRFDEAVKALPKAQRKSCVAYEALQRIQVIYHMEGMLKDLSAEERLKQRQITVKPLVEAYFAWAHEIINDVLSRSKTWNGLNYSINQEKYLKVFLEDGEVPMDNNAAEQSIRGFCIGKKNWVMIDTLSGANASAIIYSIVETAKANNLKIYEYIKYLLDVIPEHMEDKNYDFVEDLLPWSDKLPEECKKKC